MECPACHTANPDSNRFCEDCGSALTYKCAACGFDCSAQRKMWRRAFGEAGLAIHITIVSVHAVVLLSVATTLVELDLAREAARRLRHRAAVRDHHQPGEDR